MPAFASLKKSISKTNVFLTIILLTLAIPVLAGCGDSTPNTDSRRDDTQVQTYSVSFNTNGGNSLAARSVQQGSAITASPETTREGFVFDGWFTDNGTFANKVSFPYTPTGNITLYAKWTEQATGNYSVKFNVDGTIIATVYVAYGTGIGSSKMPLNPEKLGYDFAGWNTNPFAADANFYSSTPATSDTVYAIWTIHTYTVTFDSDGGAPVPAQQVTHGNTATAPAAEPTRNDYYFDGWYSDSDLTIPAQFPAGVTYNITFYAKWTPLNPVTSITLNLPTLTIEAGTTQTLNATVLPSSATNMNLIWESDNEKVAEVDENGTVTANVVGTAVIYVTADDSNIQASCVVTVTPSTLGPFDDAVEKYLFYSNTKNNINDKIEYSFEYEDYDFYYIYLGAAVNVPIYYETPVYHCVYDCLDGNPNPAGNIKYTYSESRADEIKTVISNSNVTTRSVIDENSKSSSQSVGLSLTAAIEAKFLTYKASAKTTLAAEAKWEQFQKTSTTFTETKSITKTEEWATSIIIGKSQEYPRNFDSTFRRGYYRFTLFAPSDVYLYVIRNSKTGEIDYEFKEYALQSEFFAWDYSATPYFGKSDFTSFEFDEPMLNNLPKPTTGPGMVTFNLNGASGTPPASRQSPAILPSVTRAGYNFVGWGAEPGEYNVGDEIYLVGETYNAPFSETPLALPFEVGVLYAKWALIGPGTVVFNINYGSGMAPDTMTASSENLIVLPANDRRFSRFNYMFVGWAANTTGTGTLYKPGAFFTVPGGVTTTFYAKWIANPTAYKTISRSNSQYTITDSGKYKQDKDIVKFSTFDGIDLNVMKEQGFSTITFRIKLNISEKNDGGQLVYLFSSASELDTYKLGEVKIEHGPGKVDTSWKVYDITFEDISIGKFNDEFVIRYDATGLGADTWYNKDLMISLYFK